MLVLLLVGRAWLPCIVLSTTILTLAEARSTESATVASAGFISSSTRGVFNKAKPRAHIVRKVNAHEFIARRPHAVTELAENDPVEVASNPTQSGSVQNASNLAPFKRGDAVLVHWPDGKAYRAKISGLNQNGTYRVDWVGTDTYTEGIPVDLIRFATRFKVTDFVDVRLKDGSWHRGKIHSVSKYGTYQVDWIGTNTYTDDVRDEQLRPEGAGANDATGAAGAIDAAGANDATATTNAPVATSDDSLLGPSEIQMIVAILFLLVCIFCFLAVTSRVRHLGFLSENEPSEAAPAEASPVESDVAASSHAQPRSGSLSPPRRMGSRKEGRAEKRAAAADAESAKPTPALPLKPEKATLSPSQPSQPKRRNDPQLGIPTKSTREGTPPKDELGKPVSGGRTEQSAGSDDVRPTQSRRKHKSLSSPQKESKHPEGGDGDSSSGNEKPISSRRSKGDVLTSKQSGVKSNLTSAMEESVDWENLSFSGKIGKEDEKKKKKSEKVGDIDWGDLSFSPTHLETAADSSDLGALGGKASSSA